MWCPIRLFVLLVVPFTEISWVFFWVARFIGWVAGPRGGIRRSIVAVIVTAMLLGVSFVPIYGSGENLVTGHKLRHTAWKVYREAYHDWARHGRR